MKEKFNWVARYSKTEASDKHGRWARLCYYNGMLICWVSRVDHVDYGRYYEINDFFPSLLSESPCLVIAREKQKDFETIQTEVQERFLHFLEIINNPI